MFKGESAKYIINFIDEGGATIDTDSIDIIEVLIYREANKEIVIERKYDKSDTSNSDIKVENGAFKFVINSSDTEDLLKGTYRIKIHVQTSDPDFDDSYFHNIEDAILFEIVPTVKKN